MPAFETHGILQSILQLNCALHSKLSLLFATWEFDFMPLGLELWATVHNHSPFVFPMHISYFCREPIFHRQKVQALISCTETTLLLLHPITFLPHNFPSSAIPKLLIRTVYCVQRGASLIVTYSYFILPFTLFSFPLLIMLIFLNYVSSGLICPLERGGWWIHSLLSLIQRLVTVDSRERHPQPTVQCYTKAKEFTQRHTKGLLLTGWLWLILFQELCLHALQIRT